MYEDYFGLRRPPFAAPIDPNCLFAPESVQSVIDELLLRAVTGAGIGVLTAPAGTGKTLVCRRLALEFAEQFTPIYLASAAFSSRRGLLQAILFELGRRYTGLDEQELRLELTVALRNLAHLARPVVMLVDEAHLLGERLLEEIRSLASLDERSQPLMRVILSGQSALEMRLMEPGLEAFNQRIASHVYLEPLTRAESRQYIEFRIEWAGGDAGQVFDSTALDCISQAAGGLPRCLNQLGDQSLLMGFAREVPRITVAIVDEALDTLKQLPLRWNDVDRSGPFAADVEETAGASEFASDIAEVESPMSDLAAVSGPAIEIRLEDTDADRAEGSFVASEEVVPVVLDEDPDVTSPLSDFDTSAVVHALAAPANFEGTIALRPAVNARVFEEEAVVDCYAALDRTGPAAPPVSEPTERLDSRWELPGVPALPMTAAVTEVVDVCPEIAEISPWPDIVPADGDVVELEEEIASTVMETCLEVQNALEHGRDEPMSRLSSDRPTYGSVDAIVDYDVVEPEHEAELSQFPTGGASPVTEFESRGAQPAVEKPRYQNLFSTLRRKMGRRLRRSG